ncbi:Carotenoid cleavage dioxygenase 8 -like protein B, chloroplastic [Capsicum chinense]|nr:Carotenoid cleavage dioxygenase 8 -like protein B, chloroplastic [Capsicum chinense]
MLMLVVLRGLVISPTHSLRLVYSALFCSFPPLMLTIIIFHDQTITDPRTDDNTLQIDLFDKKAKNWYDDGAVPSEPFFVARPGATEEDEGVVISMISDKNGEGYALILDGSTFEEIARAKFPYGLPYGLHGCWVPKK